MRDIDYTKPGTIKQRVARGIKWLDKNKPGWKRKIARRRLRLSSGCDCILGQIYDDYLTGRNLLPGISFDTVLYSHNQSVAAYFGFSCKAGRYGDVEYDDLEAEWRVQLAKPLKRKTTK